MDLCASRDERRGIVTDLQIGERSPAAYEERLAAGGAWEDSGLVFTSPIGTPLDPRNVTCGFHALQRVADVRRARFPDLRHSAATLLLDQGVDPRTIVEALGYSQVSLTLNTDSHVLSTLQADAAAKLDKKSASSMANSP